VPRGAALKVRRAGLARGMIGSPRRFSGGTSDATPSDAGKERRFAMPATSLLPSVSRWGLAALAAGVLLSCNGEKRYFFVAVDRVDRVSDPSGQGEHADPNLVRPIALQLSPSWNLWTANNGSGTVTIYDPAGAPLPSEEPRVIGLPVPAALSGTPSRPTGLVHYDGRKLLIQGGGRQDSARYLLATEEGTILGYNFDLDPTNAVVAVDNSAKGASYRGLAIAYARGGVRLYATNFTAGTIDVFDDDFAPATRLDAAAFEDQELPTGYAPFGIQQLGGYLYVTYAARAEDGTSVAPGGGVLDVYALDGRLIRRVASGDPLDEPWGMTIAPRSFPYYGQALLVANHGDGTINAFDLWTGDFIGALATDTGEPIVIDGLWDLAFAPGPNGNYALDFTAGADGGQEGVIGSLLTRLVRTSPPASASSSND
jgi:uncharacterized protein (TIGR03118 family)